MGESRMEYMAFFTSETAGKRLNGSEITVFCNLNGPNKGQGQGG